jgi:hypothetical protein
MSFLSRHVFSANKLIGPGYLTERIISVFLIPQFLGGTRAEAADMNKDNRVAPALKSAVTVDKLSTTAVGP